MAVVITRHRFIWETQTKPFSMEQVDTIPVLNGRNFQKASMFFGAFFNCR